MTQASPAWQPSCGAASEGTQLGMPMAVSGCSWSEEPGRSTTVILRPVRRERTATRVGRAAATAASTARSASSACTTGGGSSWGRKSTACARRMQGVVYAWLGEHRTPVPRALPCVWAAWPRRCAPGWRAPAVPPPRAPPPALTVTPLSAGSNRLQKPPESVRPPTSPPPSSRANEWLA